VAGPQKERLLQSRQSTLIQMGSDDFDRAVTTVPNFTFHAKLLRLA
jgi:hypothetical protein